jgi:hypothetical protein
MLFQSNNPISEFGWLTWVDPSFFCLLSMRLSLSYDAGHGFSELTRVDLCYFLCSFFNWFFSISYIIQHWVYWKLSFMICFDLLFIWLSWSHNSSRGFCRLTQSFFLSFFFKYYFFQFFHSILSCLEIAHHNCFYFFYIGLSWSYDLGHKFSKLT